MGEKLPELFWFDYIDFMGDIVLDNVGKVTCLLWLTPLPKWLLDGDGVGLDWRDF